MVAGDGPAWPRGLSTIAICGGRRISCPDERDDRWRFAAISLLAPAAAFAAVALLLKLADGPAYEFIYFHF
jgi:hypothetical protein